MAMPSAYLSRSAKVAIRALRKHRAPEELISQFQELVAINTQCAFSSSIRELLIDACRRFNFTAPFSMDGQVRHFRARVLAESHPEHDGDCFNHHGSADIKSEQSYRRGYDQGFAEAFRMFKESASIVQIEQRRKEIHSWRTRPLQVLGSFPGSEENFENCFVVSRGSISAGLRYRIFKRDGFRCQICGRTQADDVTLHVDHCKSVADGGSDELENLQTLCSDCNLGKSADSMH
jgi:hypothetical protein